MLLFDKNGRKLLFDRTSTEKIQGIHMSDDQLQQVVFSKKITNPIFY